MITRDNYEEYFLLYVDNELSASDRQSVERFVSENPDMNEEWEATLQCRIDPEHSGRAVFANKESLLRFADSKDSAPIGQDNYEEYFLCYIDAELDGEESRSVEAWVGRHPGKKIELERLQQTVSRPDMTVRFTEKNDLYKNESGRRVVAIWWSAAAAVILAIGGFLVFQNHTAKPAAGVVSESLAGESRDQAQTKTGNNSSVKKAGNPVTAVRVDSLYSTDDRKEMAKKESQRQALAMERKKDLKTKDPTKATARITAVQMPEVLLSKAETTESKTMETMTRTDVVKTNLANLTNADMHQRDVVMATDPKAIKYTSAIGDGITSEKSSFATKALLDNATASVNDGEEEYGNDDIDQASKKKRFRGIFRKVTRVFEKTADRDESGQHRILVGALQVALK